MKTTDAKKKLTPKQIDRIATIVESQAWDVLDMEMFPFEGVGDDDIWRKQLREEIKGIIASRLNAYAASAQATR